MLSMVLLPALMGLAPDAGGGWIQRLAQQPGLEARFTQRSESGIYGEIRRTGKIQVARGGKLRVQYDKGALYVCDGKQLTQFDPGTRTAIQRALSQVTREMPHLALLVDPSALPAHFTVKDGGTDRASLVPKMKGGIPLEVQLRNGEPVAFSWTDGTGAKQVFTLEGLRKASTFPAGTFTFQAPKGTRWQ